MRDWEIRLAKRLKRFEHDPFLSNIVEITSRTFYNKISTIKLEELTEEDLDNFEQECYHEITESLSKNR